MTSELGDGAEFVSVFCNCEMSHYLSGLVVLLILITTHQSNKATMRLVSFIRLVSSTTKTAIIADHFDLLGCVVRVREFLYHDRKIWEKLPPALYQNPRNIGAGYIDVRLYIVYTHVRPILFARNRYLV